MTFRDLLEAKKVTILSTLEYGDMPEVFEFADELDIKLKTKSPGVEVTGKKEDVAEFLAYFNRWSNKELIKKHPELKGAKTSGMLYDLDD